MKKTEGLLGILIIVIAFMIFFMRIDERTAQLKVDKNSEPVISLKINDSEEILKLWFNKRDGLYYFFLPSFVSNNKIYCDYLKDEVILDGAMLLRGKSFQWEQEKIYGLSCGEKEYKIVFMKSSNVPAIFIETESGTMEHLNADKEHIESGNILVMKEPKNVEYKGELKKISARGNSTFDNKDKKAYSFSLNNSYPLCGMDAGKKWNLLAMYFEYDKIHTKLVYDMAEILGMEYNIDCTWVDLYCNGEYQGIYLLTEAVTVGEGRVDIYDLEKKGVENEDVSGGYLLEKDVQVHLEEEGNGFVTQQCAYPFIIKNPNPASEEQMKYIKNYIQNIENLLVAGDEDYKKYIDLDSFAKQFLIDKIVLEPDAMNMSTFFYKDIANDILKVGPLWDYDRAFGGAIENYMLSIGDYPNSMREWYMQLYQDEEFKEKIVHYYEVLLPFLKEVLEKRIDEYVDYVWESVKMDEVLWPMEDYQSELMSYLEYDSYIKYLKYFFAQRLNYLNEVWGISGWQFELPVSTGQEHMVQFIMDDGTLLETKRVRDGDVLKRVFELNEEDYFGWSINDGGKIYSSFIPIYEDTVLNAKRKFESLDERMSYKLEKLKNAKDVISYMEILKDKDFSVCISIDGSSEMAKQEKILDGIKEICDYKHPDWLDKELEGGQNYFLLIDNGWQKIWDGSNENLKDINTTFGLLNYGEDVEKGVYLYIQEKENNYLESETRGAITIVAINRYTGGIVDVAAFN